MALVGSTSVMATPRAPGECYVCGPKPYRMVVLKTVGAPLDLRLPPLGDLTFGINDEGQVAFFAEVTPSSSFSDVHLNVYLPRAVFNLSAGVHDVHPWLDPALPSGFDDSVGTDINDAGKIVGLAGAGLDNSGIPVEAWLFEIDQTTLSGSAPQIPNESLHPASLVIGEQSESTSCYSVAHGISNSSPPAVAGALSVESCSEQCDGSNPLFGFTRELGGSYIARASSSPSIDAVAFSVNDSSPRRTVGRDARTYNTPCANAAEATGCSGTDNPNDGLFWSGSAGSPAEYVELGFGSGDRGVTQARDVHSDDSAVGLSFVPVGMICRPHAVWWSAGNSATNLNSVYAEVDNRTRAEAIRDIEGSGDLRVVGFDDDLDFGLLWLRLSDAWCADVLNDIAMNPAGSMQSDDFVITYAHDVNASGHVITHGFAPGATYQSAILLTCAADYNGDLLVDGVDLGILLSVWNCVGCAEDLDGSGVIDGGDLGLIGGYWHPWDIEDPFVPCSVPLPASCSESESLTMDGLSVPEALVALGFADGEALAERAATACPAQLNNFGAAFAVLIGGS